MIISFKAVNIAVNRCPLICNTLATMALQSYQHYLVSMLPLPF